MLTLRSSARAHRAGTGLNVESTDGSARVDQLRGRTCVVTGANTGVGRATATALAALGADVVLACRSRERARAVLEEINGSPRHGAASFLELDLADLSAVRRAWRELDGRRIDVLINNAGVGGARGVTSQGFELAFGTNHLGHYLFTRLILPQLAADGRVVHLGSGSHGRVRGLDLDRVVRPTRTVSGIHEYGVSKLAVMLFHHELTRRLAEARRPIASLVADPGDVASEAYRHLPWLVRSLWVRSMKSPAEGAQTTLFCATSSTTAVKSGGSYVDSRPFEPGPLARDPVLARELWERSAAWVGLDAESLDV